MEHIDLGLLTGRALMIFGLIVLATIWLFRHAGRRWFPPLFFVVAGIGAALHTGVLRQSAVESVTQMATGKLDAAAARAQAIGGQAHSTSAGAGGETNAAYEKRLGRKKRPE